MSVHDITNVLMGSTSTLKPASVAVHLTPNVTLHVSLTRTHVHVNVPRMYVVSLLLLLIIGPVHVVVQSTTIIARQVKYIATQNVAASALKILTATHQGFSAKRHASVSAMEKGTVSIPKCTVRQTANASVQKMMTAIGLRLSIQKPASAHVLLNSLVGAHRF